MYKKKISSSRKGAIIGGIVGIFIGIFMIFLIMGLALAHDCPSSAPCPFSWWENLIFIVSGDWLAYIFPSYFLESISPARAIIAGIIIPLMYFLYGVIIGWIIGKIKSRRELYLNFF